MEKKNYSVFAKSTGGETVRELGLSQNEKAGTPTMGV
jgi:hypothetical protein